MVMMLYSPPILGSETTSHHVSSQAATKLPLLDPRHDLGAAEKFVSQSVCPKGM